MLEMLMLLAELLVNVAVNEPPTPSSVKPKDSALGEKPSAAAPVPVKAITCGLVTAASVTLMAPLIDPMVEGVNVTVMVQVPFMAMVLPAQVSVSL
jgi:hypothetical protein